MAGKAPGPAIPPPILVTASTAAVIPGGPAAWTARISDLQGRLGRPGVRDEDLRRDIAVLYTYRGNEAASRGDLDQAASDYQSATGSDPALTVPLVNLGRLRLVEGKDDEAESVLRDALSQHPDDPAALRLLGEVDYRRGDLDEAIDAWTRSLQSRPDPELETRLLKAHKERSIEKGYLRTDGAHFTLKYDGERASDALSGEILDHLEQVYEDLTVKFDAFPPSVIVVTLYSREAFEDVTDSPRWVGGLFDGQIRVPIGGLTRLTQAARGVFTHELTHCIVFYKTHGNSPRWLQEGIAQWAEGKSARGMRRSLAQEFSGATPADARARFSYPQSLSMLESFIDTWGFPQLLDLLDRLGGGSDFDTAFEETTGTGFDRFVDSWLVSLNAPGGIG